MPVRLGALGALLVVTAVLIAGSSTETRRQGILMTTLRLSSFRTARRRGGLCVASDVDAAQIMRFCAIAIAGVLTIGLMTDTLRAFFEAAGAGRAELGGGSPAATRDQLISELARHPLFESARRLREAELAAYDPPLLRDFLVDAGGCCAGPRRHGGCCANRSRGRTHAVADGGQQRHPHHHPVA